MGQLIVIEGTDGSGKATQTKILAQQLRNNGYKVRTFDFPRYGQNSAKLVETYLQGEFGLVNEVSPHVTSLFYAIDRHFAAKDIAKAIESEDFVLTNRYTTANMGHQGSKIKNPEERKNFLNWLENLEYKKLELPIPDKVLFLFVPPTYNQELVDKKENREYTKGKKRDIHEASKSHLEDAAECFLQIAESKENWTQIDCLKDRKLMSIEEIADKIWLKLDIKQKSESNTIER